jgi:hypothetical protein
MTIYNTKPFVHVVEAAYGLIVNGSLYRLFLRQVASHQG